MLIYTQSHRYDTVTSYYDINMPFNLNRMNKYQLNRCPLLFCGLNFRVFLLSCAAPVNGAWRVQVIGLHKLRVG